MKKKQPFAICADKSQHKALEVHQNATPKARLICLACLSFIIVYSLKLC